MTDLTDILVVEEDTKDLVKDSRDIKRNLHVERGDAGIFVYAVAKTKTKGEDDSFITIPAKFGEPIGNECYDMIRDVYYVQGVDFLAVGNISINYRLVDSTSCWFSDIPLPLSVLNRHMSAKQRKRFDDWKSMYSSSIYNIEFLQVLNVY